MSSFLQLMLRENKCKYAFRGCEVIWCRNSPEVGKRFCSIHLRCYLCSGSINYTISAGDIMIGQKEDNSTIITHTLCYSQQRYDRIAGPVCFICGIQTNGLILVAWGWEYLCPDHNECGKCGYEFPDEREPIPIQTSIASSPNDNNNTSSNNNDSSNEDDDFQECKCLCGVPKLPRHCFLLCEYSHGENAFCNSGTEFGNSYCTDHLKCCFKCTLTITKDFPGSIDTSPEWKELSPNRYKIVERNPARWVHTSCQDPRELIPANNTICIVCQKPSMFCINYKKDYEYVCLFHSYCMKCVRLLPRSPFHREPSVVPVTKCCDCKIPCHMPKWNRLTLELIGFITHDYNDEQTEVFLKILYEQSIANFNDFCDLLKKPQCKRLIIEDQDSFRKLMMLECPLCLSINFQPKALSCGHIFCQPCLDQVVSISSGSSCSLCRKLYNPKKDIFSLYPNRSDEFLQLDWKKYDISNL